MCFAFAVFFFKQKTAYERRISDWSSDVCSSDLGLCGQVDIGEGCEHAGRADQPDDIRGGARQPLDHACNSASSASKLGKLVATGAISSTVTGALLASPATAKLMQMR